jgi:peptidoglycan/LPS O-acetylase OafA/YrhL
MLQPQKTERLEYLDSARGIAALMVLFGHFINWEYDHDKSIMVASLVFNAADAVSFFFVLSGMVLSYTYFQTDRKLDVGQFYINRIFRLYPGFLIAVLVNVMYRQRINLSFFSDLFLHNKYHFWEEAFLLRFHNDIYGPGWTLTIEMALSFFMPFLIVIGRYNKKLLPWLLFISFLIGNITGLYLFHFAAGALVSMYFKEISSDSFKAKKYYPYRFLIIPVAIFLFSVRQLTRMFPMNPTLSAVLEFFNLSNFMLSGIGALVFLVCIIHFKSIQRILHHKVLVFYGKISYGIYLMHWVVVRYIGDHWEDVLKPFPNPFVALLVMSVVALAGSTLLATMFHYWVELPCMKMGKRMVKRMKPTVAI